MRLPIVSGVQKVKPEWKMARHCSPTTTTIYANASRKEERNVISKLGQINS